MAREVYYGYRDERIVSMYLEMLSVIDGIVDALDNYPGASPSWIYIMAGRLADLLILALRINPAYAPVSRIDDVPDATGPDMLAWCRFALRYSRFMAMRDLGDIDSTICVMVSELSRMIRNAAADIGMTFDEIARIALRKLPE